MVVGKRCVGNGRVVDGFGGGVIAPREGCCEPSQCLLLTIRRGASPPAGSIFKEMGKNEDRRWSLGTVCGNRREAGWKRFLMEYFLLEGFNLLPPTPTTGVETETRHVRIGRPPFLIWKFPRSGRRRRRPLEVDQPGRQISVRREGATSSLILLSIFFLPLRRSCGFSNPK